MPHVIVARIVQPLQLIATKLATVLLHFAGVLVLVSGNSITLNTETNILEVDVQITSLLMLIMLAIVYGYLLESRIWLRVVLACAAIPLAVVGTSFRVVGTCLIWYCWGVYTSVSLAWLILALELITLFILHRAISAIWKRSPDLNSRQDSPASPRDS
jgi:hypothetical protein